MRMIKKNKKLKKIISVACILSFINTGTSYADISESYNFKNITIEDGLSQSTVETIHQDSKGYIWIGTNDGLDRYNGYEFKHYKHDKDNENSIAHNYIVDIIEDKNGYIWVATINGLSRIDTAKDEIKNYYSDKGKGNLSNSNLWQILYTTGGKFLVSSIDGLNVYDEEKDTFNRVLDKEGELPSQYIYSVKEDSYGHIWVGTDMGLVELDKDLKIVKSYKDTIGEVDVYNVYDDLKGNLWVCTVGEGLFRINLKDKSVKNYKNDKSEYSVASNTVRDAINDSSGNLWIATDKGLCIFDYRTEKFVTYSKKAYESNTLINNSIFCLFKDKSGLIWIGTYNGVSKFNPNTNFAHFKADSNDVDSISGDVIHGIYKDNDNFVWMGTSENGVNIMNEDGIKHLNAENSNLLNNTIHDITGYKNKIFIGTNEGLSVVIKEGENYSITNYTEKEGLPSNKIRSLFVDSKGSLFIGTNKGLAVLSSEGKLVDITYMLDKMGIQDKFIRAVYEDKKGNYYIGCFLEGGLIKINPSTRDYKVYKNIVNDGTSIGNNCIRYINEDLDGNILVGTSYGLSILNVNKDVFVNYAEKDGLANNTVYGVLVDDDNNIWMSTNGGISKFNRSENVFKNFTILDGLQSNEFNGRSCFKTNSGNMFFGGINGFNVFNPNNVEVSTFEPEVIFDSFEAGGKIKKDIPKRKLKYSENNVKINFFTDDYINSRITQYYYKLDGSGKDWHTTRSNSIVLANLDAGEYTLRIKARGQHGIIGKEKVVKFIVKAPLWRSIPAICVYLLIVILWVIKNRREVEKLDKAVNERTRDLKLQMEENKSLYERNESLYQKVLTLEKNKNNYFINLSHELRTPLNVLNSINQLIRNLSRNNSYISPDKLIHYMDIMERNTSRLLNLINNLIDNSKIDNDSYVVNKKDEDIVYLVEETVLDMKNYIEEKGIELIFDTDIEEKTIKCDKTDIERCIVNLVGNAVKFTHEGGLIEVTVTDLDDRVKISVKDNGIGITKENKEVIFNRFNQVVDENSEVKGGSGLGLTICKQLIELHNGYIYVESEIGVGSEFVIILPVNND